MTQFASIANVEEFITTFNRDYENKHKSYEDNFWATKMNLAGCSGEELTRTKTELDNFLGNKEVLDKVREMMQRSGLTASQQSTLKCFETTLSCYIIEDPAALALRETIARLEAELSQARNKMDLGYTDANGQFVKASSVTLRNMIRTSDDENLRKSCLEGLRSIGPFVAERFCEIVKLRNQLAKGLGYECFYDMKVQQAEGFSKTVLFEIMNQLEIDTRPILHQALETLSKEKGVSALEAHNTSYALSGDIAKLKDPYFPFEDAVDVWARSFAALGITYRGATMRLDLCDRDGKYSNGFCHWPQPAWVTDSGEWVPSQANFTSLASPKEVGSGNTALVTLMHEGGHAAHFANVAQPSPLFSQERAPTSVAYAENQSMFLDSLVSDAEWMGKYAYSRDGQPIPWEILEQEIRATHAYQVFMLRGMLAVPFFEKRLYELADEDVTPENVIQLATDIEVEIQGCRSARPMMSVPHILLDESAAYYHGYVLAEMSVHQTRKHFQDKYGFIVDNERVGEDLKEVYWKPGNSAKFLDLVKELTGSDLSSAAWVEKLQQNMEDVLVSERAAYDKAVQEGPKFPAGSSVDLDMRVMLVHGDEVVSDSNEAGLAAACKKFKGWVKTL